VRAPLLEPRIAIGGDGRFKFEQGAGQQIVVGFKQPELFRELADFGAAFFE
jgi:hypothetical protein